MKESWGYRVWADYFNLGLSRKDGRKVPKSLAVNSPTPNTFIEAAKRLGIRAEVVQAKHPKRPTKQTFYVLVEKKWNKQELIRRLGMAIKGLNPS